MKIFLSKLPLPITVLALGWVILGNIFQGVITFLSDICMIISLILMVSTILKVFLDFKGFFNSLKSPVGLSLFATFGMSLMMIAEWMKGVLDKGNIYFWVAGVFIHILVMVVFTIKYVINFKFKYIFPSWFLVYSGIGIAAITCKDFGMIVFGTAVFYFTIFVSAVIMPLVLIKVFKRNDTNAAKPLFSLIAVPVSTILSAYIIISSNIDVGRLWILFIISQVILLLVVINMLFQMFNGFYPSWSCYAASTTITLYAATVFNKYLRLNGIDNAVVQYIVYVEYVFVFLICAVILLSYFVNTIEDPEVGKERNKEKNIKRERTRKSFIEKRETKNNTKDSNVVEKDNVSPSTGVNDEQKKMQFLQSSEKSKEKKLEINKKSKASGNIKNSDGLFKDIDNIDDLLD